MSPDVQTNINNKEVCQTYKFFFYNKDGEKIIIYDKSLNTKSLLIYAVDIEITVGTKMLIKEMIIYS